MQDFFILFEMLVVKLHIVVAEGVTREVQGVEKSVPSISYEA